MTATMVNGLAVVAQEPVPSGWKNNRTGEPLLFKQIVKLLLENGAETFACVHCDYTADSPLRVRPHLNKHRDRNKVPLPAAAAGIDVRELVRRLQATDRIQADRDEWRQRAMKAERDLSNLRAAFERAGLGVVVKEQQ